MRNIPSDTQGKLELVRLIMERELREMERQALIDYYINGMTMAEIAKERGVAPSTIYRAMTRGLERIWRFLLLDPAECKKIVNSPGKLRQKLAKKEKNVIMFPVK